MGWKSDDALNHKRNKIKAKFKDEEKAYILH